MSISHYIFQNLKSNLKHYYLYVFALIFSVALYFAFVTLQFDPALDATKGSIKGAAALKAGSILLVAIVTVFNLYSNNIFVKRRSKEIGLLQLIGMTKSTIFRVLVAENCMLYFGSLAIGVFVGFSMSKLILMILFKITGVNAIATLQFSSQALLRTILVFSVIYLFIMLVNFIFIRRQTILSLFQFRTSTEDKVKKVSGLEAVIGFVGLLLIAVGYYVSSKLFGGDFTTMVGLFGAMIFILFSVISGTYMFYKGSVRLILNAVRKRMDGHLSVRNVLSLSSIMFRMKSNAMLLTVITTVSALSIGLLCLSYIAYYSVEKTSAQYFPSQFTFSHPQEAERFKTALNEKQIAFQETRIEVLLASTDLTLVMGPEVEQIDMGLSHTLLTVVADTSVHLGDLAEDQILLTGSNDLMSRFMPFRSAGGTLVLTGRENKTELQYLGLKDQFVVSQYFTIRPVAVVDEAVFKRMQQDLDPDIQNKSPVYTGIDISNESQLTAADEIFRSLAFSKESFSTSRQAEIGQTKQLMGLTIFVVGFLGLTFLITTGCILYFKQMDESEDEKPSYTILRKLGFTQGDLIQGIQLKQLFSFGIPLAVGLLHSYFAVQSGWFLFGTALWTPMMIVMIVYTLLYSIFSVLSVLHYKKVISQSL
ncbi:ABC transporter permease [Paenibacillus koleovorans]|uniref:ABC transporter permease n=1 Tax=Paenibacillus koleovorans TaxID=121608 RepID=UPI000FD8560C|nr:ABC transporter permease [Paenibacillus koleovorans]